MGREGGTRRAGEGEGGGGRGVKNNKRPAENIVTLDLHQDFSEWNEVDLVSTQRPAGATLV